MIGVTLCMGYNTLFFFRFLFKLTLEKIQKYFTGKSNHQERILKNKTTRQ